MHPRDRFITIYGRKPALEALDQPDLHIDKLLIAHNARGPLIERIVRAARHRGLRPERRSPREITRLSRNGRQDQGVALDVVATRMQPLEAFLADAQPTAQLFLLDGVTTPANVGLIMRSATAAGIDGIVLPRAGCPEVGPLVIKASAGVALRAPIVRAARAAEALRALRAAGFRCMGLDATGSHDVYSCPLPDRAVWVLGNESVGLSAAVVPLIDQRVRIPMSGGVESLNVATAGAVVAFEIQRRRLL